MLNEAIVFSVNAHSGQVRKATNVPYIVHPLEALVIMSGLTTDETLLCASVLHDTVEDCESVTISEIEKRFGKQVAMYVEAESEDKTKSWQERKETTITFLKSASKEHCMLALADKLSNMRAIARDYKVLGEDLWQRFRTKDKKKIGWYYQSLALSLSSLSELDEYNEYVSLVERIFGSIKEIEKK